MKADDIKRFLAQRYQGKYAFFKEFRPFTGFAGNVNQIDAIAVGLFEADDRIICFEIKTTRADFLSDVSRFKSKHKFALDLSHEFYYVCPWKLIAESEVPEISGLIWINKGHKPQIKKQAQRREINGKNFLNGYFRAFMRHAGDEIKNSEVPIKWLGREISQKDFSEEIAKETRSRMEWEINQKAKELYLNKLMEKEKIIYHFNQFAKMVNADHGYISLERKVELIKDYIRKGKKFSIIRDKLKQAINPVKELIE